MKKKSRKFREIQEYGIYVKVKHVKKYDFYGLKMQKLISIKGDLRTICRFSYMKVYKLITLGTKFKTLLSLGRKITMFSKFITNYIEQG